MTTFRAALDECKRDLITRALAQSGGNRAAAGRQLGLTRAAVSNIVKRLGIAVPPGRPGRPR